MESAAAWPYLYLFLGILLLYLGGEGLVRGSASLALRLGLTPLVVGLTVAAFGTSSPELVVSVRGALAGRGGIAAGNVVGSNIFNIGVVLALTSVMAPMRVGLQAVRVDVPIMLAVSLAAMLVLGNGHVGRAEGAVLAAALVAYTVFEVRLARKEYRDRAGAIDYRPIAARKKGSAATYVIMIAAGLALLTGGAHFFVEGAAALARRLGISEAVIGLTVVAAGTSIPELATNVVAALRRQPDIAIGNIVGSNIFNILGILGAAALVRPLDAAGLRGADLAVMMLFACALLPLARSDFRLDRREGLLLLVGYVAYLAWLWPK